MMRRALALVALLALGACGKHGTSALASAEDGLGSIRRGTLALALTAGAGERGHDVGFRLEGPFDMTGPEGSLPVTRMTLTRQSRTMTFESNGKRAWVEAGGRRTALTDEQVASLRLTKKGDSGAGLHVEDWAAGGKVTRRDGDAGTTRLDAEADAVRVLNDVFALAGLPTVDGKAAQRLDKAVRSSHVTATVGRRDDLLRSLTFDVTFAPDAEPSLRQALGDLASLRLHLDLRITEPRR
jgi:hypothetical protein